MTAALTKISYSEEQKAIIHFYNQEDWEIIKRESENYDKKLNAEYEKPVSYTHLTLPTTERV